MDKPTRPPGFVSELKRRRVVRVALVYGAAAYAGLEGAELVLSALLAPEWVLSLLVMTAIVGFPIAVALSWLFDFTPQGIRRTRPEESGPPATWLSTGSVMVLGGMVLAVAAGWWLTNAAGTVSSDDSGGEQIRSIAVLPFDNVGEGAEDDYFADGLGDELRELLSRLGGLDVAARTSSIQVRVQATDPVEIAQRLGVQAVLHGTVLKQGDRVRVAAKLVSGEEGQSQLWNGEYERLVDDIFEVQTEIASSIARALDVRLPQDQELLTEQVAVTNAMAYDKYLWGQFNANRRTPAGVRDAIDNFIMSIEFDSTYAPAWAGLAESYGQELEFSLNPDPSSAIAAGLEAAQIAVALDATSLAARTAMALFRYQSFDWIAAETELRSILAADPSSSSALVRHAEVLTAMGETEQAVTQIKAARRVDGLSSMVRRTAARVLASSGRIDEAIREAQEALRLSPDHRGAWTDVGFIFLTAGRFNDARNTFQRVAELISVDPEPVHDFVASAERYLVDGVRGQLPAGMTELSEGSPGTAALYHASVGDVEEALALLEAAVERREYDLATLVSLPILDPLRDQQRFRSLLASMGISG